MDRVEDGDGTQAFQPPRGPLFHLGAVGLLTLMAVEAISVIGRHIGIPLLGALEIMQAAILIAACAAMVIATVTQAHASAHLLVDRLSPRARQWLLRAGAGLSALFFAGLTAGSLWLAIDFWSAHEQSELLGISFRVLRGIATLTTAIVAVLFLQRALRGDRP
jgi:TRAP-type C4-dicarboxylate transport system permease small subunit